MYQCQVNVALLPWHPLILIQMSKCHTGLIIKSVFVLLQKCCPGLLFSCDEWREVGLRGCTFLLQYNTCILLRLSSSHLRSFNSLFSLLLPVFHYSCASTSLKSKTSPKTAHQRCVSLRHLCYIALGITTSTGDLLQGCGEQKEQKLRLD